MADAGNERFSLKRWSRRKLDTTRVPVANPPANALVPAEPAALAPATATDLSHATPGAPAVETPLPPVDSLTFDSDFRGFLQPKVDETVKRAALKKLFSDPRFNVMDGLDVYIDDYSKSDPLPREWLQELASARNILNPPRTRVNEQGFAEDVPPGSEDAETASTQTEETPVTIEPVTVAYTSASDDPTRMSGVDTVADDPAGSTRAPIVDTNGDLDSAAGAHAVDCPKIPRTPA